MKTKTLAAVSAAWALSAVCTLAAPLGTAFTYQGNLTVGTNAANGIYDLRFTIYDDANGSHAVSGPITNSPVGVTNGLFTTTLDFGADVFSGDARWLEMAVRTNGGGDFVVLSPRQSLMPVPYALYTPSAGVALTAASANAVAAANITGTLTASQIGDGSIDSRKLASGSIDSTKLAAGSVTTAALADSAVTADKLFTVVGAMTPTLALTNPVPTPDDCFGRAVAFLGGNRILVGAPQNENVTTNPGVAFLFDLAGNLVSTFTNPAPTPNDQFGYSLAVVGSDKVLIGARRADTGATDSGAAYLFSTNGTLLVTFTNPTPATSASFGYSVTAVGSDRVLIGAHLDSTVGYHAGAAYLFKTDGTLVATFTLPTPNGEAFGGAVTAVGGDRVLIGAFGENFGAFNAGAAYLFHTNGTLLASYTDPHPATYGNLGWAVAAVGSDKVLIAAPRGYSSGVWDSGVVYLFGTNGALLTTFTNPAPSPKSDFGFSVAMVGSDKVLIGASQDGYSYPVAPGVSYLFDLAGRLLLTITNPVPVAGSSFGGAVAAWNSDRALIGAYALRQVGGAGKAYLYSVAKYAPGVIAEGVRSVDAGQITTGTLPDARLSANVARLNSGPNFAGAVTAPSFTGSGTGLTNLAAGNLTGTLPDASLPTSVARTNQVWLLNGNGGTTPGVNFLGTTDNQPLEFKLNNARALRLEPTPFSPNVMGGFAGNWVSNGVYGATIGGGGMAGVTNRVAGNYATVVGGAGNFASGKVSTAMGYGTTASGTESTAMGEGTTASGTASLAAGTKSQATNDGCFVWADYNYSDFGSTSSNQFLIRAGGGVGINTNNPSGAALNVAGTVLAASFQGSGSGLTGLNASQLTSGTVPLAQLPGAVLTNGEAGISLTGSFSGDGSGVTNVDLRSVNSAGAIIWTTNWGNFILASTLVVGNGPRVVIAPDVNGDGWPDLVCVNDLDRTLTVLPNNGHGGFVLASSPTVGNRPIGVTAADVNGDGWVDLINANYNDSTLTVLTNDGHGGFVFACTLAVDNEPILVIAADVNGDGRVDLISANWHFEYNGTLTVLTNDGHGGFGRTDYGGGNGVNSVAAADVNGDGRLDLICGNYDDNTLTVLTNNGQGGFVLASSPGVGSNPCSVIAADVNGDGWADLICANITTNTVTVLTNNGHGGFVLASSPVVGSEPWSVTATDVNGDGWVDLISANANDNTLTVLTNNGRGGFVIASTLGVGSGPASVAAADANGDGWVDLICANFGKPVNTNTLTVLFNTPPFQANFAGNGSGLTGLNAGNITSGTIADARLNSSPNFAGTVTAASFSGNGAGLTGLDASSLTTGVVPDARLAASVARTNQVWLLSGNGGTTPGVHFLGTTDNQPLEFKANNARALRLEPTPTSPNVIGGYAGNWVSNGVYGATIGGGGVAGATNRVAGNYATVVGGGGNLASGEAATAMGAYNIASGTESTAMGIGTIASGPYSTAMGLQTTASGDWTTAMGAYSTARGFVSTAMGLDTTASGDWATAMGDGTTASGADSTAMGAVTIASGWSSTAMGDSITASGIASTAMGKGTTASGAFSFAAGTQARATNDGCFVWADYNYSDFGSTSSNQFLIRAGGGVGINKNNPATALDVNGTVTATAFNPTSDRNLKENFGAVSPREVLDKVAALPITRWNFKGEGATPHVGPMAQDFRAAFGLGTDDKHIATVDADGVALAAIQGLNRKLHEELQRRDAENAALRKDLDELKALVRQMNSKLTGGAQ